MNLLKNKIEEKNESAIRLEELVSIAEKRQLTSQESLELDSLERLIIELNEEIKPLQKIENRKKKLAGLKFEEEGKNNPSFGGDDDEIEDQDPMKASLFHIQKKTPFNRERPISDFVLRNFDVDDRMKSANVYGVIAGLCGRKYKPGSVTEYALDQTKKSSLSPSALLNPFLSAQLLEGGLSKSRAVQAGMKTFAMVEGTHKFARVAAYPALEWKAELATTTERTITFDNVTFAAKTLRGWVQVGAETIQDALNIEQALKTVFDKSIGNGVDNGVLYGTGASDDPLGVANYVGIPTLSWNAPLENYDAFIGAQKLVHDEDGPDLTASIMSPDAWSQLARLKGTSEFQPMNPPFVLANHKFLQTTKSVQTTGDGTQSEIIMGGFENLNLGVRLQAEIMLTPVHAESFSYKMLAVFRGDAQPNRVEDFALITGVDPAPALT